MKVEFKKLSVIAVLGLFFGSPLQAIADEDRSGYSGSPIKGVPAVSAVHEESSYSIETVRAPASLPDESSTDKLRDDDGNL